MTGRVSLQTFLGNCLEEIAGLAFDEMRPTFDRSPAPPSGLISPDFFREGRKAAFAAVTSTPTRNTFQKKKWRYVHEVFSLKQYYAESDPVALNVQLSPPGALQPLDEAILRQFFDTEVKPDSRILAKALALLVGLYDGKTSAAATVRSLKDAPAIASLVADLKKNIELASTSRSAQNRFLWQSVRRSASLESRRTGLPFPDLSVATCLRNLCFGLLLLPGRDRVALVHAMQTGRALSAPLADKAKAVGFELAASIGGPTPPGIIVQTVKSFGSEWVLRLCDELSQSEELQHIIADLTDQRALEGRVRDTLALLSGSRDDFIKHVLEEFNGATNRRAPKRLESLDYVLLLGDLSITEADKWLANEFGDLGAANRIQCMISARCQGRFSFKDGDTQKVAARVFDRIRELRAGRRETLSEATDHIIEKRRAALSGLGGEANPVEIVFRTLCKQAGVELLVTSMPCLLTDRGLRGRGVAIERIYVLQKGGRQVLAKVLSGYKGGYEHKAEELSGRAWLLRYRQEGERVRRDNTRMVFICEGEWDRSAVEMLLRAGWDDVILCLDLLALSPDEFAARVLG